MSSPAQWISTSTRPLRSSAEPTAAATASGSVRSTWYQCAVPPFRRIASIASSPARPRSIRASSCSTSFGVGRSPAALMRSARSCLRPSRSAAKRARSGSAGSGSGTRSSRWKAPPPAAVARSAVIADTMLPAAPVTRYTASFDGARAGSSPASALDQADAPAQIVGVADLDGARVVQRLVEQEIGERRRLAVRAEVDALDERVGALAGERLGEAGHGAAEHGRGAVRVVAVATAEPGRGDQERPRRAHLAGERPQRDRQELHPDPERLVPARRIQLRQRALVVERGEPVHALDRPGRLPLVQPCLERLGVRGAVELEHLDVELAQPRGQRGTDAAAVGAQHDAAVRAELHAGRDTAVQRWAHDGHGNASRVALRFGRRGPGVRRHRRRAQAPPARRRCLAPAHARTPRHGSASDSRAASASHHARSRRPHGSSRSPRPA